MVSLDVLTVSQGRFFLPGIFGVCHPAENLTRIKWDDRYDRGRRRLSPESQQDFHFRNHCSSPFWVCAVGRLFVHCGIVVEHLLATCFCLD
jgi:hypothetical protein